MRTHTRIRTSHTLGLVIADKQVMLGISAESGLKPLFATLN